MIDVSISLPNDGIFFAGEKFECIITFSNDQHKKNNPSPMIYGSPLTVYSPSSATTSTFPSRRPSAFLSSPRIDNIPAKESTSQETTEPAISSEEKVSNQNNTASSQQNNAPMNMFFKPMYSRSPSSQYFPKQPSMQKLRTTSSHSMPSMDRRTSIHSIPPLERRTSKNSILLPSETIVVQNVHKKKLDHNQLSNACNSLKSSNSGLLAKSERSIPNILNSSHSTHKMNQHKGSAHSRASSVASDLKGLNITMPHTSSDIDLLSENDYPSVSSRRASAPVDKLTAEIMDTFGLEAKESLESTHKVSDATERIENIIFATAQISGSMHIDSSLIKNSPFEGLKSKLASPSVGFPFGIDNKMNDSKSFDSKEYPIYFTASTVLSSNIELPSGASKSYRFEIELPRHLPPSFKGVSFKTSFKFILGIQRGSVLQKPKIFQIPIRIFNRAEIDGSKCKYDALNPIMQTEDASVSILLPTEKKNFKLKDTENNLIKGPQSPTASGFMNCLDNISWVCQTSQRVKFDISKDNEHIAKLFLSRSDYRLGESIVGLIDFSQGTLPSHYVSAYLEAHENIDSVYALKLKSQYSKATTKVFASSHLSVLNLTKVPLSLFIPSHATPDFETSIVNLNWFLRIEFITSCATSLRTPITRKISPFLQLVGDSNRIRDLDTFKNDVGETMHFVHLFAVNRSAVDVFDCLIPVKVFGNIRASSKILVKEYSVD